MQLSLRLPRPRLSLGWLGALAGRMTFLYIGYTAVLFLFFLVLTFPHELLIRRVMSSFNNGPVTVQFTGANFAWLKGYELVGMRIATNKAGAPPLLECSHFWIRPAFDQIIHGHPYAVQMSADLYGGSAQGALSFNEGSLVGKLELHDLNLGRYRALTAVLEEGELAGRLSGVVNFEGRASNLSAGQAAADMSLDAASLTGAKVQGVGIPDVHVRQTKLKFNLHAGRLELQELKATGDANVDVSGQIALREPLPESQLNLKATIETTLATPDPIKGLVALIPRQPGSKPDAPVTISGSIARPRVR